MASLNVTLKNLKSETVDLDFLVKFYELYLVFYNTGDKEAHTKLKKLSIPLANSYLSRSNNRFSYEGGEDVFNELFSYCYTLLLTILERRKLYFPDVQQFYAYFDKRLVLSIQSHYVSEFCNPVLDLDELPEETFLQKEFQIKTDEFESLSYYIQMFSEFYSESDFLYQFAHVIIDTLLDTSSFNGQRVNKFLISQGYNTDLDSTVKLKLRGYSIARCSLIFALDPEINPQNFLKNLFGDCYMLDSQFLYILALEEKYPGFLEVYHSLDKNSMDKLLLLFEGRQVTFPRLKDYNQTKVYIDIFIELNRPDSDLEKILEKFKITKANLKYELQKRFSILLKLKPLNEFLNPNILELLND